MVGAVGAVLAEVGVFTVVFDDVKVRVLLLEHCNCLELAVVAWAKGWALSIECSILSGKAECEDSISKVCLGHLSSRGKEKQGEVGGIEHGQHGI